jgi:predicted HAD superfamily Cof-like phosphohydrolase
MIKEQQQVAEFHKTFEIPDSVYPTIVDHETQELRVRLIQEEFDELKEAMDKKDLIGIADGLADILYVVYGTAVSYGLDMDPIFQEVHRSNMSKVGGHKREDGKWVKPPTYSKADLAPIIRQQIFNMEVSS